MPTGSAHAAVVYNPVKVDLARLREVVDAEASAAGWDETKWYETSVEDPGQGPTAKALEEGATVVLAAGGDGTVRAVAEGLHDSGVPIALLPSGTGNLLARNLELTLDHLETSVRTAFTGTDRRIDLGLVEIERDDKSRDKHVFLVMAGLGLDAKMIANTNDELKKKVGWLAYVDAIARSLRGGNRLRVRFRLDEDEPRSLSVNTILIGNCGMLPANILLLPEAVVDDGIFDIVALRPQGLLGWIQIWVKVVWENGILRRTAVGRKFVDQHHKEVRTLRYMKGRTIVIRPETPQEFQLDGDTFGQARAVKAWVDPQSLAVRIPSDEADRLPTDR